MDPALGDLRLVDYRPRSRARVAEHSLPRPHSPVVDAHNHLGRWLSPGGTWIVPDVRRLLAVMEASGVEAMVNLDGRWGAELEANLDRYDRAHPGRFATFCHLDWGELTAKGSEVRLVQSLEESAAAGAMGVKVWKDLGLGVRDESGRLVLADDPRLDPVWEAAGGLGLPVVIHSADPVAFFDPVDRYNERLEELLEHPDWSFCAPGLPSFDRLIDALEAVVAAHPGTIFIGAHVGCYAEDLSWVQRMLDTYPNFNVDIAARLAELGRQPRAARRLILRHPSRVLFGIDSFPPAAEDYALHFRFLETDDENFDYSSEEVPPQGRWRISALHLPHDVLQAVYALNARRLIPGLAATTT